MRLFCSIFIIIVACTSVYFSKSYDTDIKWLIDDIATRSMLIVASIGFFISTSYRNTLEKTLALESVICCIWWMIDYALLTFFPYPELRTFNDIFLTSVGGFICINALCRSYNPFGLYNPKGCFFVYKKPKNILGAIAALVGKAHGSMSIVCNGEELVFKHGTSIIRKFNHSANNSYIKIGKINIYRYTGVKWNIFNNCFVFCWKTYAERANKQRATTRDT